MLVAVAQMHSTSDKERNVGRAVELIHEAAKAGAGFVLLPEYAVYLGPEEGYAAVAEPIPGPTTERLGEAARRHGTYVCVGTIIEPSTDGRFFNTSVFIDPAGEVVATYRKIHLFDIDVPGEATDTESAYMDAGDRLVVVDTPAFTLGMSICFDVRFPELYRALASAGANVLTVPSAFTVPTGRAHWKVLLRARAIENHAYVLAAGQHGTTPDGIATYGHSMIVDPWGQVLQELPEGEGVLVAEIDIEEAARRRGQIPVLELRRPELYEKVETIRG